MIRQYGEILELPFSPLHFGTLWRDHFDHVPYGRRNHVAIILVKILLVFKLAKDAGKIPRDAGFLGNDKRFGH